MAPSRVVAAGPLVLRPWRLADVEAMERAITESLEHLRPWMPWVAVEPLSRQDRLQLIDTFAARWDRDEDFTYGVFLGDEPVGGTGLHARVPDGLEIGYWIHPRHTGRGYATAAAAALTAEAFTSPDVRCVEIHHDEANRVSGRIPARLSFERVAEQPDQVTAPGEVGVEWQWRMTRARWTAR